MYNIRHNTWTPLPELPCYQKYSFCTVHGDEIWIASNSTNEFSAFNFKTKTHRLINIDVPGGHSIMISHLSILYVITCGNNGIIKITGQNDEHETKSMSESININFNYTYSPFVFHGNKYYLVDCERNLLVFDVEKEQLTSTPHKFDNN